jgi:hypothetical protein
MELKSIEVMNPKRPEIRFALIENLIQITRIKAICTRKSIPKRECGNCAELKSPIVRVNREFDSNETNLSELHRCIVTAIERTDPKVALVLLKDIGTGCIVL